MSQSDWKIIFRVSVILLMILVGVLVLHKDMIGATFFLIWACLLELFVIEISIGERHETK